MSSKDRQIDYRIPFSIGMLLFLLGTVWDTEAALIRYLLVVVMVIGGGLMAWGIHLRSREEGLMDERFLRNRLKASRVGLIVGLVLILGLVVYEWMLHQVLRWEFLGVVAAIAVAKVAAMLYYQRVG